MRRAQCVLVVALFVRLAHSWDVAITKGDQIEFYNSDGTKIQTVQLPSQNLAALAYDEIHNMLLYSDKQYNNDAICGYNMTSSQYNCYVERNGRNIHGLAFDPVTETLFFTDTTERSINTFSFKHGSQNNVYGNLLIKLDDGIPTDIAVDSCKEYVYWINLHEPTSTIERARFDGSGREVLYYAHRAENLPYLNNIHSVAIDQQIQQMIWLNPWTSRNSYTFSTDLNGQNRKSVMTWGTGGVAIAANYKMEDQFQGISECNHVFNNFCVHGTKVNGQFLCNCKPGYTGVRCEISACENYCSNGNCSVTEQGNPTCRCEAGYSGERCEVNVCKDHCVNNGTCSLDNDRQPICQCQEQYMGQRCEIPVGCVNYCLNGNCSFTEQGHPKCRCEAGYSGVRCEVDMCNKHCVNNGTCSLNEEDEPVCDCVGEYEGDRCEVPKALRNGCGSLNKENQPVCQCVRSHGSHDDSGRETDKKQPITSTSTLHDLDETEESLTLADLLKNWRQHNNIHSSTKA